MKRLVAALLVMAACVASGLTWPDAALAQTMAGVKRVQVANNTTPIQVCAGPCTLTGMVVFNNSATVAYLKLYAQTSSGVTVGTTTVTDEILIPASTSGAGAVIPLPGRADTQGGVFYPSGLTMAVTTGYADSDTTAPAANAYLVTLYTK